MKNMNFVLMISLMLCFLACEGKRQDNLIEPGHNSGDSLLKASVETGYEEFRPLMESVAEFIAREESRLSRELMRAEFDRVFVLSDLFSEKRGIVSQRGADGTPYEIGVDFSRRSTFNDAPARVALDPDRFYPDQENYPSLYLDPETKALGVETIAGNQERFAFPLIFVTLEDRTEIRFEDIGKGERKGDLRKGAKTMSGNYLAIRMLKLNTTHESGSQEIEIFIREGDESDDPVYSTTSHMFNGVSRNDAAGNYKLYPDVNSAGTSYYADYVALWPLSGYPVSLTLVEDDAGAGTFRTDCGCQTQAYSYFEEYRVDQTQMYYNVDRYHNIYSAANGNDDDVFQRGMLSNFTEDDAPPNDQLYDMLSDFYITLKKHDGSPTLPDPPPAPTNLTINSTQYGYPVYLTWSSSSGATGYKVERNLNGGAYVQIGTTSHTYYTDNEREVNAGGGGAAYTTYRVKAYNAGGDSSPSSAVFSYTVAN